MRLADSVFFNFCLSQTLLKGILRSDHEKKNKVFGKSRIIKRRNRKSSFNYKQLSEYFQRYQQRVSIFYLLLRSNVATLFSFGSVFRFSIAVQVNKHPLGIGSKKTKTPCLYTYFFLRTQNDNTIQGQKKENIFAVNVRCYDALSNNVNVLILFKF